jgi:hypothetical protein
MQARIKQAMVETQRYIDLEGPRAADLRPVAVAELLEKYKAHMIKLQKMFDDAAEVA